MWRIDIVLLHSGGLFQRIMEDESIAYYFNGGRILFEYIDYFDGGLFQV